MEEFSQHILDLLMNSWEAGASDIELYIEESVSKDVFKVTVIDNGKGMTEDVLKNVFSPFTTKRTTRRYGFGLAFLQGTVENCNGRMNVESQQGEGCRVNIDCQLSHWDMLPLGDMSRTITAFLCSTTEIRLKYVHNYEEKTFVFDTKDITESIYPVKVNNPKVLQWMREQIAEGLKNLKDGGDPLYENRRRFAKT